MAGLGAYLGENERCYRGCYIVCFAREGTVCVFVVEEGFVSIAVLCSGRLSLWKGSNLFSGIDLCVSVRAWSSGYVIIFQDSRGWRGRGIMELSSTNEPSAPFCSASIMSVSWIN